jgi:hypothetical protein
VTPNAESKLTAQFPPRYSSSTWAGSRWKHYGESTYHKTLFQEFGFTPVAVAAQRSLDSTIRKARNS